MTVVLASVAARSREIGLRKALGATPAVIALQFFVEVVVACAASGVVGFLAGAFGVAVLAGVELPRGFSRPVLDLEAAAIGFALLALVAVVAGLGPAWRAARLPPAAALRGGG
jgi:putative ABC transport system permease protein